MTWTGLAAEFCRSGPSAVPSEGVPDNLQLIARAARQHHLVTVADVRRLGISEHRWRTMRDQGWWEAVSPSHYRHASTPDSLELRVRAGLGWLGKDAALFGTTALWWMGAEVDPPDKPEFLVPRIRRSLATGMTIHTTTVWEPIDLSRHRGLRTTTGARAIIDMAGTTSIARRLEQAIDSAVAARRTSFPQLERRLAALDGRGRPGCSLLRELLLDSGGESRLERRFLRLVRLAHLPRPRCQVSFRGSTGRPLRVDFLFDRLVVEVSGRLGHVSDRDRQRDARRRIALQQQGHTVIEFTTADVIDDPEHVLRSLRHALHVTTSSDAVQKKW